jgi:hypothetical protein
MLLWSSSVQEAAPRHGAEESGEEKAATERGGHEHRRIQGIRDATIIGSISILYKSNKKTFNFHVDLARKMLSC